MVGNLINSLSSKATTCEKLKNRDYMVFLINELLPIFMVLARDDMRTHSQ